MRAKVGDEVAPNHTYKVNPIELVILATSCMRCFNARNSCFLGHVLHETIVSTAGCASHEQGDVARCFHGDSRVWQLGQFFPALGRPVNMGLEARQACMYGLGLSFR
jgi:hypothetical protein